MKLYQNLSKIGFLKNNYTFKFLFIAFIGIPIPLVCLFLFQLYGNQSIAPNTIVIFGLIITLVATITTLLTLKQLILPIVLASKELNNYRQTRFVSSLPTHFEDEVGLLLRNIQEGILENEDYINEKQDLIYLLSHDLRIFATNPKSLANLIIEENSIEKVKELAHLICQSSDQQLNYIENFIKLLKEHDEIIRENPEPKLIKLDLVLNQVKEQIQEPLINKNIKLLVSIEVKEYLIKITTDLLIRVLVNLIDNAIKFSFSEQEIEVKIYSENKKIRFDISDKGVGFDSSKKEEIFNKFTKMSRLGTANESSTGIGLYLCKKIVEKNQGKLTAFSDGINKGAVFSMVF